MNQFPSSGLPVSTFPAEVQEKVIEGLGVYLNRNITAGSFDIIAGGCISHGGVLHTSAGDFFIKWNDVNHFPGMFEVEHHGLSLLQTAGCVRIPKVIEVASTDNYQLVVLEYIHSQEPSATFWQDLGHSLARLHDCTSPTFGLSHDNYIGSLKQSNKPSASWVGFFVEQRISPQLMMAEQSGLADHSLRKKFNALFAKLDGILPDGKPSLMHGDLWSGNLIPDDAGNPCLIDPAVYYGNSEMEIAYTRLFGAFDDRFYAAYSGDRPLAPGFWERLDIYNLYPLLVHTNLFGRTYLNSIEEILKRFS